MPYLAGKTSESLLPPTSSASSAASAARQTFRLVASPLYEIIESTARRTDFKAASRLQCCRTADNVHYSFEVAIFVIYIHFTRFSNMGLAHSSDLVIARNHIFLHSLWSHE